jgi:ribonuclease-3
MGVDQLFIETMRERFHRACLLVRLYPEEIKMPGLVFQSSPHPPAPFSCQPSPFAIYIGVVAMTKSESAQKLEKFIEYHFEDPILLEDARTRKAFRNENPSLNLGCMDSLATLGDSVLGAVVVYRLYENGKQKKGELTKRKISGIRREQTRAFADRNELSKFVYWGKGELKQKSQAEGDKALDAVTEALIGAVFLDAQKRGWNGMDVIEKMLERLNFFLNR